MKKKYIIRIASALALLSAVACQSQAAPLGTAFTYQGRLNDGPGAANGSYNFQFKLFDALTEGAQQGSTVGVTTAVTNGLFTATLDFGSAFTGNALWLEIATSTNGAGSFTTLAPRQALTAAPYASYASSAGAAASALTANSASIASSVSPGAVSQLGAPDGSPLNAVQVNANGLVGVGTSAPSAGLQVSSGVANLVPTLLSELVDNIGPYTNLAGNVPVAVSGNLLALGSSGDYGLTLVDITAPSAPQLRWSVTDGVGSYTNLAGILGVTLTGNLLAIAAFTDNAVTLVDVSTPSAPVFRATLKDGIGSYTSLGGVRGVQLSGNLLAIAAYTDSAFTLVDVTTPASPVFKIAIADGQLGFNDLGGAIALARTGNLLAIAASTDNAVTLVDVSDPSNPILRATLKDGVGVYTNLANPQGLAFSGNLLAIAAANDSAVTLVDVSLPSAPVLITSLKNGQGGFNALSGAQAVQFQGSVLWIGATSGLTAVDVSNPSAPVLKAVVLSGARGFSRLAPVSSLGISGNTVVAGSSYAATLLNGTTTGTAGLVSDNWVGIGTTQPAAPLHVNGSVLVENATSLLLQGPQMSIHSGKTGLRGAANGWAPNSGSSEAGIFIEGGTGEGGGFYADGDIAAIWSPGDGDILRVYDEDELPNGAPKFVIDPSGRVGVLTNKPQAALHVAGTARAQGFQSDGPSAFSGNVAVTGNLSVSGNVQASANTYMNDKDILLRGDANHGLGWYGSGKTFAGFSPDGPVLYGCSGGGLGTECGTPHATLTWDSSSVTVNGNLGVTNSLIADSATLNGGTLKPGLLLGGSGSGEGISSKRTAGGNQYGLDFYTGLNLRMSIFSGGGVSIGGTNAEHLLDVNGNTAIRGTLLVNSKNQQNGTYPELPGIIFGDYNSGEVITSQRGANGSNLNGLDFYTGFGKRLSIANNGNVGIGRQPTANRLEVAGNASKDVAGSWLANSDSRIKQAVQPVTGALEKLDHVRLVSFRYTDDYRREHPGVESRRYVNVVAQEFREVFPDDVKSSGERLPDGSEILQVDTYPLTIYSAAAVQELNHKLKEKDAELQDLKARLERLEILISAKRGAAQ